MTSDQNDAPERDPTVDPAIYRPMIDPAIYRTPGAAVDQASGPAADRVAAWRRVMADAVTWCGMACAIYVLVALSEPDPPAECDGMSGALAVSCVPEGTVLLAIGLLCGIPVLAVGLLIGGAALRLLARVVRLPRVLGTVLGWLCLTATTINMTSVLNP